MKKTTRRIPQNRPLSPEELSLVSWLIAHGTPEAQNYAPQIEGLRVTSGCSCGCPTIDFYSSKGASAIVADFYGVTAENVAVGVILHIRDGRISEMEIYPLAQHDRPFGLPKTDTLKNV
jgi:hypothetical protein